MKEIDDLLQQRRKLRNELKVLEKNIFKYETVFLEITQGTPMTKSLEYYSTNKSERKKYVVKDNERMFSRDHPKIHE